jgi:hypothetical protein
MKRIFPILFILSLVFTACSDDKASLKLQMNKGDVFDFEFKTSNNMDQSSMGQKIKMVTEVTQFGNIEVLEVTPEKQYKMRLVYTRGVQDVDMSAPTPNKLHIDTSEPDTSQTEEALQAMQALKLMMNKPFEFTMNDRGEVLDCKSKEFENALDSLVKDNPMMKILGEQISIETQKMSIQSFFIMLPEGKASEGTTWTTNATGLSSSYPVKMENTYTIKKTDENFTELTSTGKVTINKDAKGMMAMMVKMMELGGDVTSEVKIDSKSGLPIQNKQVTKIKGSMNMFGSKMPIEMEGTTIFSMKKR